jgi:hypothetical protein
LRVGIERVAQTTPMQPPPVAKPQPTGRVRVFRSSK